MRHRRALSLAAALLWFGLGTAPAKAEPSVWELARSPRVGRVEKALRRLGQIFDLANQPENDAETTQDFRLWTLARADVTGARELGDPRLLILLAEVTLDAQLDKDGDARRLLERAESLLGPDDAWLEAQIKPLLALTLREDPTAALRAVDAALPLVWDPSSRSALLRERAEARMALFDVRQSLFDARRALDVAATPVANALCRFEVAVALERAGDLPAALRESHLARLAAPTLFGNELGVLELSDAFIFRPQDADYAGALAHMAEARFAIEEHRALSEYERAIAAWNRYLEAAPEDRWAASARAHAVDCERRRALLAERLKREPASDDEGS